MWICMHFVTWKWNKWNTYSKWLHCTTPICSCYLKGSLKNEKCVITCSPLWHFFFFLLDTQEYVLQNFQVGRFHVIIMNWMLSNLKRDVESLRKDHKSIHMTHAHKSSEAIWIKVFNWQCSCVWTIEATQEPEQIIQIGFVNWINQIVYKWLLFSLRARADVKMMSGWKLLYLLLAHSRYQMALSCRTVYGEFASVLRCNIYSHHSFIVIARKDILLSPIHLKNYTSLMSLNVSRFITLNHL